VPIANIRIRREEQQVLRPQDTSTRETKSLDGLWAFRIDPGGVGFPERWWDAPLRHAREMPVPSSYNEVYVDPLTRNHVGDVWYQKLVWVPAGWAGKRIVLRFGSATHRATVWVESTKVASHEGGYLPFEADITAVAAAGTQIRVTAVVNNELTFDSIPPGIVTDTARGRQQVYFHDFFNYAGLHRSVTLYCTPAAHLGGVSINTAIDGTTGVVTYVADVVELAEGQVRAELIDDRGGVAAHCDGALGVLRVPHAHLWGPGAGYLYQLKLRLVSPSRGLIDEYSQPVGIRSVGVEGQRFLINGRPFHFRGVGKHEDGPLRGRGHDDVAMVHDFALLDWLGANSFRTSHYPYAEEVLDYADRNGIVVIDETPAVGLNLEIGPLADQGHVSPTFSDETISDTAREHHLEAIGELIARDRNHPCVVIWSIANEPDSSTAEARRYFEPLFAEARRLDPSRPVGFANYTAPATKCRISDLADILMLNRYYGWYSQSADLAEAESVLRKELAGWRELGKPIVITEYGADAVAGIHSVFEADAMWTEDYQAQLLAMCHRVFDETPEIVGEHVWAFADFATPSGVKRVDGNKKGLFTRDRRPKAAARLVRERWHRLRTPG
jgi:beta-glucuronidase